MRTARDCPLIEGWFGPSFALLDPQLQALHRNGGRLRGPVQLFFGAGLAGMVGRLLARRLGIPPQAGTATLEVNIASDAAGLHWSRRFNDGPAFNSVFQPAGGYPDGHWVERSGPIELWLQVGLVDGGWHWRQKRLRLFGVPLPGWLMPRTVASKRAADGNYIFCVAIQVPLLGTVLSYGGSLQRQPA